jgi:hypothetical protein
MSDGSWSLSDQGSRGGPVRNRLLLVLLLVTSLLLASPGVGSAVAATPSRPLPWAKLAAWPHATAAALSSALQKPRHEERAKPAHKIVISVSPAVNDRHPALRTSTSTGSTSQRTTTAAVTAAAADPTPPFTQCPAVGLNTSCAVLVEITDTGTKVFDDPSQGPYDGVEDTLIGVVNSSGKPVSNLALSSDTDLFGFDGDGLCDVVPHPAGCPFGPTGYEGPKTTFSNITPDASGGVVNFTGDLAVGEATYLSLEERLPANSITVGGPTVAEQGGPANPSEHPTTCSTGPPVNCATGEFWHQFADLQVPGRGVPLDLTHTYRSAVAGIDGPLGFGWTDSYNMSLTTDPAGNVTISQENGSTVSFRPNGTGGYTAPPRVLGTLLQNSDGT